KIPVAQGQSMPVTKRRRSPYSSFIDATKKSSVTSAEVAERIAERDERQGCDTRSPAEVLMNDPETSRSALSMSAVPKRRRSNPQVWKILGEKRPVLQVRGRYAPAADPRPWLVKPK